jgi:hypothetical protein
MTNEEMQLIDELAKQLKSMSDEKSYQADLHIQQMITPVENAMYKLVQIVLMQDLAIEKLQMQLQLQPDPPAQPQRSFLGGLKDKLFGRQIGQKMHESEKHPY